MICVAKIVSKIHKIWGIVDEHCNWTSAVCWYYCSPFENVDTTGQTSQAQPPAYTDQTAATLYANDAIANSGTFYEEISSDHVAGTMRVMVRALYDYKAVEDDELSLTVGKVIFDACDELLWIVCCQLRNLSLYIVR